MIGMWFFLPSPTIATQQRQAYVQNKLTSGKTVITVFDYAPLVEDSPSAYKGSCSFECEALLVHWRLILTEQSTLLRLSDYDSGESVNLTDILEEAKAWNTLGKSRPGRDWVPYISPPLDLGRIPSGSTGEEISMPWFHVPDQKLIYHDMHNTYASILVHAVVPEPEVVEFWRGPYVEHAGISAETKAQRNFASASPHEPLEKITYEIMASNKQQLDLLAAFQVLDSQKFGRHVMVKSLAGELPSQTYPIRRALQVPLGLFIAIPFILFRVFADFMSPFLLYVLIWLGLLAGLVCYRRMLEGGPISSYFGRLSWDFNFLRWRRRSGSEEKHVWGPTGPVDVTRHEKWFDEEKEIGLQRPQTGRLGKDWKT
jgi:hypothetical protein